MDLSQHTFRTEIILNIGISYKGKKQASYRATLNIRQNLRDFWLSFSPLN